jgi:hypothetical protein
MAVFLSGANLIKLYADVNYGFSDYARVFVRLDCKKLTNDKHSSLLRKSVIYGQKSFITLDPGANLTKLYTDVNYGFSY